MINQQTAKVFYAANSNEQMPVVVFTGGTGDGGGSSLEPRIAKLESDVNHIKDGIVHIRSDLRGLLYILIGGFIFLITTFGVGYTRLDDKITASDQRLINKMESIEQTIGAKLRK